MPLPKQTHECAAKGCNAQIAMHLLMCGGHWARVPKDLQSEVYRTWRRFRMAAATAQDGIDYVRAVRAAVDSLGGS